MLKVGCAVLSIWALLNLGPSTWIVAMILLERLDAPGLYALLTPEQVSALPAEVRASANSIGVFANALNAAYALLFLAGVRYGVARRVVWAYWALVGSSALAVFAGVGADLVVGGAFPWMNVASAVILIVGFGCCAPDVLGRGSPAS